jgi:hypothetical protein
MNRSSLSHSHIKNQQSSWIDDPFQLGTNVIKGLRPMIHKRDLSDFAQDLVGQYAKFDGNSYILNVSDLSETDQNELIRLYLEFSDRDLSECLYGDDFTINSNFTCALLSMLKDDSEKSKQHFADVTLTNLLIYFKDSLNEILGASCDNLLHVQMNDQGYYAQEDQEHGDIFWGKFK